MLPKGPELSKSTLHQISRRIQHSQRHRCVLLEGIRAVRESLYSLPKNALALCIHEKLWNHPNVKPLIRYANRRQIPAYRCTNDQYKKLTQVETGPGILGIWKWHPQKKWPPPDGRYVYLYEVRDPGNLGTIIRTVHAFGFDGCILAPRSASPFNPKVVRASMGMVLYLPIWVNITHENLIQWHQHHSIPLFVLYQKGNVPVWSCSWKENGVLIVGSETEPFPEIFNALPKMYIPMYNDVESLNVAVATALGAYEWSKWVRHKNDKPSKKRARTEVKKHKK